MYQAGRRCTCQLPAQLLQLRQYAVMPAGSAPGLAGRGKARKTITGVQAAGFDAIGKTQVVEFGEDLVRVIELVDLLSI